MIENEIRHLDLGGLYGIIIMVFHVTPTPYGEKIFKKNTMRFGGCSDRSMFKRLR